MALGEPADVTTVGAALAAHAAAWPERPALFFPEGWDVRWRSFRTVAAQVAGGSRVLARLRDQNGWAPGTAVGFRAESSPDALAADLAIQAAGLTPVPLGPERGPEIAARLWLPRELPEVPGDSYGAHSAALPGAGLPWQETLPYRLEEVAGWGSAAALLAARAAKVPGDSASNTKMPRSVVAMSLDGTADGSRMVASWAILRGSALYLEPSALNLPGGSGWVRPMVIGTGPRELATLTDFARKWYARRRLRRSDWAFGRLHSLLLTGHARLAPDDLAFWTELGVRVQPVT